jgi:hypothetical protein
MVIPNYTYLKLKMPSPKGVVTIEGSFEQAYYCKQDCITQAAMLIAPCAPDSPSQNAGRVPAGEVAKTAAVLDRPSIGKAVKTSGEVVARLAPPSRRSAPQKGLTRSR